MNNNLSIDTALTHSDLCSEVLKILPNWLPEDVREYFIKGKKSGLELGIIRPNDWPMVSAAFLNEELEERWKQVDAIGGSADLTLTILTMPGSWKYSQRKVPDREKLEKILIKLKEYKSELNSLDVQPYTFELEQSWKTILDRVEHVLERTRPFSDKKRIDYDVLQAIAVVLSALSYASLDGVTCAQAYEWEISCAYFEDPERFGSEWKNFNMDQYIYALRHKYKINIFSQFEESSYGRRARYFLISKIKILDERTCFYPLNRL